MVFTNVFLSSKKVSRNCTVPIYVHKIKPSQADSDGTKCFRYLPYQILSESDRKMYKVPSHSYLHAHVKYGCRNTDLHVPRSCPTALCSILVHRISLNSTKKCVTQCVETHLRTRVKYDCHWADFSESSTFFVCVKFYTEFHENSIKWFSLWL